MNFGAMAEGEDWNDWAKIIHSVCLTSKTPLTMNEIARDVKMLEDVDVPYRSFKYRSLEDMVKTIPNMKVFNLGGRVVAQAIATEASAHISKMVGKQRSAKKKRRTIAAKPTNRYIMSFRRPNNYNYNNQNSYNNQSSYNSQNNYKRSNNYAPNNSFNKSSGQYTSPKTAVTPKVVSFAPTPPATPPQPKHTISSFTTTTPVQQRYGQGQKEEPRRPSLIKTVSPQTQQAKPSAQQINVTISTPTTQQTSMQQKMTTSPASVQDRLNIQKPRTTSTAYPMNDPRLILNSYVEARGLALPIYKDVPSKDKNIYTSVTVNSKKYSSYPNEAKTKEDAEKLAAQAALADLLDKSNIPQMVTTNRAQIMQRILDIVNAHPNGLFESSVVVNYVTKYREGLPPNWLKMVEHTLNIDIGANNLTILSPQQNIVGQQSRPTSPTSIDEPPSLNLTNLSEFWFRVYVVYNTKDVWGVVISESHSDQIHELSIEMKHFYDINAGAPTAIVPGQFYAVFDNEWHRVRCIQVNNETNMATVFFIDRGDEDVFEFCYLRDLGSKFYKLPAQALQLSLEGLESLCDCTEMQDLLEKAIVEEDVWVAVDLTANRQIGAPLSARCYIQKEKEEVAVDVNLELITKFMSEFADPKAFMKTNKAVCEVHVSEIRNKDIFVQVKSVGLKLLNDSLTDLAKNYLDVKPVKPATRLEKAMLYLVKNEDKWRRIKILKEVNDIAQVECIDEGSIIKVPKDNLVAIDGLSNVLAVLPRQAIQVNLHKISPIMFDEKMAAHLRSLAPKDDVFYMKVVGDLEVIARVELYKRTETNYLASLNDTLALEPEISSKTDDNNNDKKSRLRNDRKSLNARTEFPLKTPEIPPIDKYFDVLITMAAHPGNFTVQPLKTANELKKLMFDLAVACKAYNGPPLTSSNVKVGNMYAAKYDNDGKWYRAYVSKILGKNICAVYFCDYGDYRAVSLEQLQPLSNQFYDLPYQAIKAKLHGITPKLKGDWTVKDSLRFNELVVDKSFVSTVKAVDNTAPGETILSLELIDTSTNDDVYIIQQLVEENRAEIIKTEQTA